MIADIYFSWIPAWSQSGFIILAAVCAAVWLTVRLGWGKALGGFNPGIGLLRLLAIGTVIIVLLGPTQVDRESGQERRPTLFYLFDGSSSMQLGQDQSRWDESIEFVTNAHESTGTTATDIQGFRFGHRLLPLGSQQTEEHSEAGNETTAEQGIFTNLESLTQPTASDSRLADAMRQILPRLDLKKTAGVVLLSDGRVRSTESVETLADYFRKLELPIHVVPVGKSEGTGDVAIVSLVVEPVVRKYTENELQVFFRSFGYTGRRTTVRLVKANTIANEEEVTIASIPVTLSGGAQSASLKFRMDLEPLDLSVIVDPVEDELAERNNRVDTHIDIDRTKLRVLYVEGDAQAAMVNSILRGTSTVSGNPFNLQQAVQNDEDVECIMLVSVGGRTQPMRRDLRTSTSATTFPKTRTELFAYDCIIFSNFAPDIIGESQLEYVAQWVIGRGGGLVIAGSRSLRPDAWDESPLAKLLPVELESLQFRAPQAMGVSVERPEHPIWQLNLEVAANRTLLSQIPQLTTEVASARLRPTAETLATFQDSSVPMLISQRVGRGRVLVSTGDIGGQAIRSLGTSWGPTPEQTTAKFLRNIIYWATEGSSGGRRRLISGSDKRFYRPGDRLQIVASAFDESAKQTRQYRVYAMFEPTSLDDMSLFSPVLWPESIVRDSGEVGPRIAWGEELLLPEQPLSNDYKLDLNLSESGVSGDNGMRIEMTAYEGEQSESAYGHGTQVDSTSLSIQILSDPFEQQNPLPNHEFLTRIATLTNGQVLDDPKQLAKLLQERDITESEPKYDYTPAWSRWWVWCALVGFLSVEWIWRRATGMA